MRGVSGPFVFIATNRLKEGKLDAERSRVGELVAFIEEHEPQLIAFNEYASDDGTEVTVVQVHPDAGSMERHMWIVADLAARAYAETLEATTSVHVFGEPSDAVIEMLERQAGAGVALTLRREHLGGFTRTAAGSETEANRRVVTRAFEGWQAGEAYIADLFAAEMTWRIEGRSLASGEYGSKQRFVDEVLAPFGARFSSAEPFRPVAIRSIHADGDTVVVLWDGRGIAADGEPYENSYAWSMRMRDGLVIDGTAFYDAIAFDELWTRVAPRS